MSSQGIHARGLAASYAAGRKRVREINEDVARLDFLKRLLDRATDYASGIVLTELESDFVLRLVAGHDRDVPDLHSGDRNICDKLRRKYQTRLDQRDAGPQKKSAMKKTATTSALAGVAIAAADASIAGPCGSHSTAPTSPTGADILQ